METQISQAFRRWLGLLFRIVERRPLLITLITAALSLAVGASLTFLRATTPWSVLPDYDYWVNITGLITENGVFLDPVALFRHNNEHIVVIPKLIYLANYFITSGSNIGLIVYSIFAGAVCAILLLLLARDLLRDVPARWVLCGMLFPLVMFSAKLSHSYYFGMSGAIWLTADIFVILSAAAMARAAQTESAWWLLASLIAALLGMLTYSTALYSLLVLLVFCGIFLFVPRFRGRIAWPILAAVAVLIVVAIAAWLIYRPHPKGHPPLDFDPIGLVGFVIIYLGSALSEGYLIPITGLMLIASVALAIRHLLVRRTWQRDCFVGHAFSVRTVQRFDDRSWPAGLRDKSSIQQPLSIGHCDQPNCSDRACPRRLTQGKPFTSRVMG